MSYNISDIEGIGPKLSVKLERVGITTVQSLLKECSTKSGRKNISAKTGIAEEKLLKWVNMVDLYRVEGIGIEYTELLEAAGVEAIDELKKADPEWLYEKMQKINSTKKFVLTAPSRDQVEGFVQFARSIKPMVMN